MTKTNSFLDLKKISQLANYCYTCNACNMTCPLNLVKQFSPRYYLTQLKQKGIKDIDSFLVNNEELYKCLTCQLCMKECPMASQNEGMNLVEIIRILREYAFRKKLNRPVLDQMCTHSSLMPLHSILQSQSNILVNSIDFLKADNSIKIAETGDIAFFLGCFDYMEQVFEIPKQEFTDIARGGIKIFNLNNVDPVVVETKCCGHDLYWMGDTPSVKQLAEFNIQKYKDAGVKTIVAECAEGYYMWNFVYPTLVPDFDFKVLHFSEYVVQEKIIQKNILHPLRMTITYHDPCRLGRLSQIYEPPRQILSNLQGIKYVEMEHNRDSSYCCGVPLFLNCNSEKKILRELRIQEAVNIGADYIITTCPKCIVHYNCYLNELLNNSSNNSLNESQSTISYPKLLDLATFLAKYFLLI